MSVIGIRADGNSEIGTGHIMRCMSIASQVKKLGHEPVFLLADNRIEEMVVKGGFKTVILNTDWEQLEGELLALESAIRELNIAVLLIDTYFVTDKYLRAVRSFVKTAYIDDLFLFDYSVDVLFNYSSYADTYEYDRHEGTRYCLGTEYAPLREQFQGLSIDEDRRENSILVLSGGTDPHNMGVLLPKALLEEPELSNYRIVVVRGAFAPSESLVTSDRVTYLSRVENMAELMCKVEMCISAGGTTLYELCACAVPTVTYSFVDNQLDNVNAFKRLGVMHYAGDLRNDKLKVINNLVSETIKIKNEPKAEVKRRLHALVDGEGARRMAEVLVEYI